MSEEQLRAFMEAVKADAGLQDQLKAAADSDAVVAIAKEPLVNEGLSWQHRTFFGMSGFRGDPAPIHLLLAL